MDYYAANQVYVWVDGFDFAMGGGGWEVGGQWIPGEVVADFAVWV